mgnify:CR=1 FL=1
MPSPNPGKALAHNLQQFDLSSWLRFCLKMLAPKGQLYLINRTEAVTEIITALYGRTGGLKIIPLFSKPGQTAKRVMIIAEKDSKAPAAILPGLTVHTPDGGYTDEAFQILRGGTAHRFQRIQIHMITCRFGKDVRTGGHTLRICFQAFQIINARIVDCL